MKQKILSRRGLLGTSRDWAEGRVTKLAGGDCGIGVGSIECGKYKKENVASFTISCLG